MPYTLNGVGTKYYFKSNVDHYEGVCESCNRQTTLESYETGYWFVILFIPVIPLGKKMIIDYCPSCTNHRVTSIENWKKFERESLDSVVSSYENDPGNYDLAIHLHETLLSFNKYEEAEKLIDEIIKKFPDDFNAMLYAGEYFENTERDELANEYYEKAHNIDPKNLTGKRSMGLIALEKGEIDKAWKFLSFMEEESEDQDAGVLFMLAEAMKEDNRYKDAYSLYKIITRDFPLIAESDKEFRNSVIHVEQMLQISHSVLPGRKINWKKWVLTPVAIIVILTAIFIFNHTISQSQKLYIVNGFSDKISVSIPGETEIEVLGKSRRLVRVKEGRYEIKVKYQNQNQKVETIKAAVENSFFGRFFSDKTTVINPGGAAALYRQTTEYRAVQADDNFDSYHFYTGQQFLVIRDIDYLFKEFPETVMVSKGKSVRKNKLSVLNDPPSVILQTFLFNKVNAADTLTFAETHIDNGNRDDKLIPIYTSLCIQNSEVKRCLDFLKKKTEEKDVRVDIHRSYQSLFEFSGNGGELIEIYDDLLKKEPENSKLLYLRGRVSSTISEAEKFYEKAIASDNKNPYAYLAKGFNSYSKGNFQNAKKMYEKSLEYKKIPGVSDVLYNIMFALGENEKIVASEREKLKKTPLNYTTVKRISKSLFALGKKDEAEKAVELYLKEVGEKEPYNLALYKIYSKIDFHYLMKEYEKMEKLASKIEDDSSKSYYTYKLYLEQGDIEKALSNLIKSKSESLHDYLLIYVGFMQNSKVKEAEKIFKKATELLENGKREERAFAKLLKNRNLKNITNLIDDTPIEADTKKIFYSVASEIFKGEKKELKKRAKKLNSNLDFPHNFINEL